MNSYENDLFPIPSNDSDYHISILQVKKQDRRSPYGDRIVLALPHVEDGPSDKNCRIVERENRVEKDHNNVFPASRDIPLSVSAFGSCSISFRMIDMDMEHLRYMIHGKRELSLLHFDAAWDRWSKRKPIDIYPRAGNQANAFYKRNFGTNHEIRLFSFRSRDDSLFHTAGSFDIVAHETGHAILDLLSPPLYDSRNLETAGFHESFGDLIAMFISIEQPILRADLITILKRSLKEKTFLPSIGVDFVAAKGSKDGEALRSAINTLTMRTARQEAYGLSQVFTGAIYDLLDLEWTLAMKYCSMETSTEQLLYKCASKIRRVLIKSILDLPTEDPSFVEIGRLMEKYAYKDVLLSHKQLRDVFANRGIDFDRPSEQKNFDGDRQCSYLTREERLEVADEHDGHDVGGSGL